MHDPMFYMGRACLCLKAYSMDEQSYIDQIEEQVGRGNYHAAINIAISGLNHHRRNNDQEGVDRFIQVIKGIVEQLEQEYGSSNIA